MNFSSIFTNLLHLAYVGLSIYGTIDPRAAWVGPVVTVLASTTNTPQSTFKKGHNPLIKGFVIIICGGLSLFNYFK